MKKDDYNDRIEDYLDGSMSNKERLDFERLLATDPDFRKLLDERKEFQELYVTTHKITRLRSKISEAINSEKATEKTTGASITGQIGRILPGIFGRTAVAAAIIALAVIGSLLLFDTGAGKDEYITLADRQAASATKQTDSITGKAASEITGYANREIVTGTGTFDEYFPDEFTKLHTSDTIRFAWPEPRASRHLMIFDSKGQLVKKLKLKKKASEYLLMPGILGEGIYYWKFMNDTTLIRISVNKKP